MTRGRRLDVVDAPDVQYARSGELATAYQVFGDGPVDLVFARGFAGDLLTTWEQPLLVRQLESFEAMARVLMLDKRGTGLSDGFREPPTLETRTDDLRLVMDGVGSERALLWSAQDCARLALLFAATYPERTAGLVLYGPHATSRRHDDYPWAPDDDEWRRRLSEAREGWGTVEYFASFWRSGRRSAWETKLFSAVCAAHAPQPQPRRCARVSAGHDGRRRPRRPASGARPDARTGGACAGGAGGVRLLPDP